MVDDPDTLSPPNAEDIARLGRQWLRAQEIVKSSLPGSQLDQSMNDLQVLQAVLDAKIIHPEQTYDLQCLGIAFGRVLARHVAGLDWAVYAGEVDRSPTIRYRTTSLRLNVLTMISKRVERGEAVDVKELFNVVHSKIEELRDQIS